MTVTAVVGANWGDEGKGKITDALAGESRYVVRFQGGCNAGHTIVNNYGKFALHLLPSGVFNAGTVNVIGPGVALDIAAFLEECDGLLARGIPDPQLRVSDRAEVVMPYHRLFDELEEARLGDRQFGSTKKGIAPFYADKYLKLGVQVADLYDPARLQSRVESAVESKNVLLRHLYNAPEIDSAAVIRQLRNESERLAPFVSDTTGLLHAAIRNGDSILLEGQLGALRDPDHGIYPFSTSSSTLAGFGTVGAGIPPYAIQRIIAVTKAYSSCVGAGPFVSELDGSEASELREQGHEYGATTGRPRRVGWFDAVATRYGCMVQGATEVAITNLDVLGYLKDIQVCIGYEIDGAVTKDFPVSARLDRAKPILTTRPGWLTDISHIREFDQLPTAAQDYVRFVEQEIGVPIRYVSNGPKRDQLIKR